MTLLEGKNYFSIVSILIINLIINIFIPDIVQSSVIKDQYYLADKLYSNLAKQVEQQKYREKWMLCINEFNKVYRAAPTGPWAAAGLYRSGLLYIELHKRSSLDTDIFEAIDILKRITKRFPQSLYNDKAEVLIRQISEQRKSKNDNLNNISMAERLNLAVTSLEKLKTDPELQKYRYAWIEVINSFIDISKLEPTGNLAAEALFVVGNLYLDLYRRFLTDDDRVKSNEIFKQLQTFFPEDLFAKDSIKLMHIPNILSFDINNTESVLGSSKYSIEYVTVKNLRVWSNPTYTRVVIDLDGETSFTHKLLEIDPLTKKPQRLYVDLNKSKLSENIKACVQVNDELLRSARAGQHAYDTVRVVVDIKSFDSYKIFTLKNPYRIVMDILGYGTDFSKEQDTLTDITFAEDISQSAIVRQLSLGVDKIVIDPGHGGRDYGASGILKDTYEKDITLQIANRLAQKVRNRLGCKVVLTRKTDCYLSLEERTAIANTENADLLVSIHTNAAENRQACGIETFFLNLATDNEAILTAARENATSTKNISDLESILKDLIHNAKIGESSRLAHNIQDNLCSHVKTKYKYIVNKGVKQAPFYVLLGAQMPAVLVETSFISNNKECKLLKDTRYQETLCDGIVMGIKEFIELNKTVIVLEQDDGN